MAAALTQDQVAALLCLTDRRVRQMDEDGDGPPRSDDGKYPVAQLGDWLKKRFDGGDKARLTKAQADVAVMEAAELSGELIRRAATVEHWGKMTASFRARLLVIPPTVAPRVAAPGRVVEVQHELQKAINEALTELADG
jgi:phage terminase Nu1 subunit (DNA packaging protein)